MSSNEEGRTITTLSGGQWGSEAKGLLATWFAKNNRIDLATTDCGPNSGHVGIWGLSTLTTFHLPMSGLVTLGSTMWLNGGAIIHIPTLLKEIETFDAMGYKVSGRLVIHPDAAIIEQQDIDVEKAPLGQMHKISGTQKGVAAAAARKLQRTAKTAKDYPELDKFVNELKPTKYRNVVVEVGQGYSLGINAGFYPYCTHRACTPAQGLMSAGIPTTMNHKVIVIIRTNPIRVGSLPGGSSGDCYADQRETTWEAISQPPQLTTVTKRLRRVFTYSQMQVQSMIETIRPHAIVVNFAQYSSRTTLEIIANSIYDTYDANGWQHPVIYFGYGPKATDIIYFGHGPKATDMREGNDKV